MKVTYLNGLDGQRHTLIDDINQEQAEKVCETFGINAQPYMGGPYVTELQIEQD